MIKSTANKKSEDDKLPMLMKSKCSDYDLIVMVNKEFIDTYSGMVVHSTSHRTIGEYRTDWCKDSFEIYKGFVNLENKND